MTATPTMAWPLRRTVQVAANRPAVRFEDVELSYARLSERCQRLAGALGALGVGRGDRVAVVAQNSHRYLELYLAVPAAGMVLVPLNARHTAAELRYALEDSGARVVFAGRRLDDLPPCVDHVVDAAADHERLIVAAPPAEPPEDVTE